MSFMLIALISVFGSGLVGVIGVLVHFLLKQGVESRDRVDRLHGEVIRLHGEAMAAIVEQGVVLRDHADRLHGEAMAAIAEQGDRLVELHLQAMAAVAALGERTAMLEAKAGWR